MQTILTETCQHNCSSLCVRDKVSRMLEHLVTASLRLGWKDHVDRRQKWISPQRKICKEAKFREKSRWQVGDLLSSGWGSFSQTQSNPALGNDDREALYHSRGFWDCTSALNVVWQVDEYVQEEWHECLSSVGTGLSFFDWKRFADNILLSWTLSSFLLKSELLLWQYKKYI